MLICSRSYLMISFWTVLGLLALRRILFLLYHLSLTTALDLLRTGTGLHNILQFSSQRRVYSSMLLRSNKQTNAIHPTRTNLSVEFIRSNPNTPCPRGVIYSCCDLQVLFPPHLIHAYICVCFNRHYGSVSVPHRLPSLFAFPLHLSLIRYKKPLDVDPLSLFSYLDSSPPTFYNALGTSHSLSPSC
ncbi:hypothetical protein [Phaffia rhodozyma]|uniref:Uncharacterized protein n=1 Tax=Phaffia rhodozyma TaxID=264483 RepID=A0A0F7SHI9_PHARH|nr:hypothetical protein [Phaffia rhodozyma]